MLTSLIELARTGEFEDTGSFYIVKSAWLDGDLVLNLHFNLSDGTDQTRSILCHQPRSHHILAAEFEYLLSLTDDHVLLWPHLQPSWQLHFNGRAKDSRALLGALVLAHHRLLGEWFPFSRFINPVLFSPQFDLLGSGYGLLATGPQAIIDS